MHKQQTESSVLLRKTLLFFCRMGINEIIKVKKGNVCSLFIGLFIGDCGKILLSIYKTRLEMKMMKGAFV